MHLAGQPGRRLLLDEAVALATRFLTELPGPPLCAAASEAGALRRREELIKEIELVAASDQPVVLLTRFCRTPGVSVVGQDRFRAVVRMNDGTLVTLHVVAPAAFAPALQRLTGPADHNDALAAAAAGRGLRIADDAIADVATGEIRRVVTEADLYTSLGLPVVPPELRDSARGIERAATGLDDLVDVSHIRGDLHTHTTASDGKDTVAAMAQAAIARGYQYLAITEHTPNVDAIVDRPIGLDVGRLREHVAAIRELARTLADDGFTLLAGAEVDILPDGSLDYPDDVLTELDWVVASPHVDLRQPAARATARMVAAAAHPLVDVIGHPTGRHLLEREPAAVDPAALVAACAEHGTFLEINANPERLDLSANNALLALDAGVPLVISTDAHQTATLGNMIYGVIIARRSCATQKDIVNTRSWAGVESLRKPGRGNPRIGGSAS